MVTYCIEARLDRDCVVVYANSGGSYVALYSNVFNNMFVLINECLLIHNLSISPMHNVL